MYGTKGTCYCYRSTNLMDWEAIGNAIDKYVSEEIRQVLDKNVFAPEVVYDKDTQEYYMFFSATPALSESTYILLVATSKSPYKDFKLVNFAEIEDRSKYEEYYAKYSYFDPEKLKDFYEEEKNYADAFGGYLPSIDPHPYEDETGKYLFWVDQDKNDRICAVKMKDDNWLTPDWSTVTVLTCAHYRSTNTTETVEYDFMGSNGYYVNEAPAVIKHEGKYYLTYSSGRFATNSYRVIQAVAEPDANGGPLGAYQKLDEKDGAIILSSGRSDNRDVTGTGHHSFVTAGDKLYMVYHRHDDPVNMGSERNPAIDEVKWITNSNGLDVLYANGPTCTLQPKIDAFSEYTNIADEATVSVASGAASDVACLTDGFLSISNMANSDVVKQVGETKITETTTFAFNFNLARDVRGIMVYNSKKRNTIFTNVSKIELVCVENGVEVTRTIENIAFNSEYYTDDYVTLGAAAFTEFASMNVKSIKITVDVPVGQQTVGISEVRILGK